MPFRDEWYFLRERRGCFGRGGNEDLRLGVRGILAGWGDRGGVMNGFLYFFFPLNIYQKC